MNGWKLVPVEPTDDMLMAFDENCDGLDPEVAQSQWQKILAACPVPPAGVICDEVAPITEQAWRSLELPPAGEVEVLKVQYRVSAGPQTGWSFWGEGNGDEFRNSYQVEVRELVDRAHVTRLTAENARLQADFKAKFQDHKRELQKAWDERDDLKAEVEHKVVLAVRDICELDPASTENPECICITASDLGRILSRHFEGVE